MFEDYFRSHMEACGKLAGNTLPFRCPFPEHDGPDRNPSAFGFVDTGWVACSSCGGKMWVDQLAAQLGWETPPEKRSRSWSSEFRRLRQSGVLQRGGEAAAVELEAKHTHPPIEEVERNAKALWESPAVDFLRRRGIVRPTAKRFQLGHFKRTYGRNCKGDTLTLPFLSEGKVYGIKYRKLKPRPCPNCKGKTNGGICETCYGSGEDKSDRFTRYPGDESILFNRDSVRGDYVIITEGEIDAISVAQILGEEASVVSGTAGGKKFDQPDWIATVDKADVIYLCFDSDAAGKEFAGQIAKRLNQEGPKCRLILLPGVKDVNEWMVREIGWDGEEDLSLLWDRIKPEIELKFRHLMRTAQVLAMQGIEHGSSLVAEIFETPPREQKTTPWGSLNKLLTDVSPGFLTTITADPKIGKTSLALQWLGHRVNVYDESVLMYCLDMGTKKVATRVLAQQFEKNERTFLLERAPEGSEKTYLELANKYFRENPGWWFCGKRFPAFDGYLRLIAQAVKYCGVQWVCMDHFHKFLVSSNRNYIEVQEEAARRLQSVAQDLGIRILLVVQPKKGEAEIKTAADMLGSGALHQEADHCLTLSRAKSASKDTSKPVLSEETYVRLDSSRWCEPGVVKLVFDGPCHLLRDSPDSGDHF